jgi:hypothetical protein
MRRAAVHVLVILALLFQGVVSVGADISAADHQSQQHCAGHDMSAQDCACCPGGVADTNCTVQCSVLQASEVMQTPTRLELRSNSIDLPEASVRSRFYAPIDPPPIS